MLHFVVQRPTQRGRQLKRQPVEMQAAGSLLCLLKGILIDLGNKNGPIALLFIHTSFRQFDRQRVQ